MRQENVSLASHSVYCTAIHLSAVIEALSEITFLRTSRTFPGLRMFFESKAVLILSIMIMLPSPISKRKYSFLPTPMPARTQFTSSEWYNYDFDDYDYDDYGVSDGVL